MNDKEMLNNRWISTTTLISLKLYFFAMSQQIHSISCYLLAVPLHNANISFLIMTPVLWNGLLEEVKLAVFLEVIRRCYKAILFDKVFNGIQVVLSVNEVLLYYAGLYLEIVSHLE